MAFPPLTSPPLGILRPKVDGSAKFPSRNDCELPFHSAVAPRRAQMEEFYHCLRIYELRSSSRTGGGWMGRRPMRSKTLAFNFFRLKPWSWRWSMFLGAEQLSKVHRHHCQTLLSVREGGREGEPLCSACKLWFHSRSTKVESYSRPSRNALMADRPQI